MTNIECVWTYVGTYHMCTEWIINVGDLSAIGLQNFMHMFRFITGESNETHTSTEEWFQFMSRL